LLDADAVHLPEGSVDPSRVRALWQRRGRDLWISRAVHADGDRPCACDAWLFSPVAASRKGRPATGFEALSAQVARAPRGTQVFALGGIGPSEAERCLECGASVAAITAVYTETERLLSALQLLRSDSGN
jgi:thiamine monophosphate synthase